MVREATCAEKNDAKGNDDDGNDEGDKGDKNDADKESEGCNYDVCIDDRKDQGVRDGRFTASGMKVPLGRNFEAPSFWYLCAVAADWPTTMRFPVYFDPETVARRAVLNAEGGLAVGSWKKCARTEWLGYTSGGRPEARESDEKVGFEEKGA